MTNKPIKSAKRALEIFELFALAMEPRSISEISMELGIPQSSTSELISSLVELGFLHFDASKRTYYPTLRMRLLSERIHPSTEWTGELTEIVDELSELTNSSVLISMRNGIKMQYIFGSTDIGGASSFGRVGMQKPAICCASGWSLLTHRKTHELEMLSRRAIAEERDELLIFRAKEALAAIQRARETGYALSTAPSTGESGGLAIRIPFSSGPNPLALVVCNSIEFLQRNQLSIIESFRKVGLISSQNQSFRALQEHLRIRPQSEVCAS